jgi:CheY-like chemotaxis protein
MSELQTASAENLPTISAASTIEVPLVLVASGKPASRLRRARQLAERGFRVAVARTGFEMIVKACCHLPDLIVVDDTFGDSDPQETTKLLSSCPATAHIPIVRVALGRRLPTGLHAVAR